MNFTYFILYYSYFTMLLGFFSTIPFITTYFNENIGISLSVIGSILAIRLFAQKITGLYGGYLSDKYGPKIVLSVGLLVRSISFYLLSTSNDVSQLCLSMVLFAFGGALSGPSVRSAFTMLTATENRKKLFSTLNILDSVSFAAGPIIGAVFLKYFSFSSLANFFSISHVLTFILVLLLLKGTYKSKSIRSLKIEMFSLFKDRSLFFCVFSMAGYYFVMPTLYVLVPVEISKNRLPNETLGYLFSILSLTVLCTQFPIVSLSKKFRYFSTLKSQVLLGYVVMFIGITPLIFTSNLYLLGFLFIVLGISNSIFAPLVNAVVSKLAPEDKLALYFSSIGIFTSLFGALGVQYAGISAELQTTYLNISISWALLAFIILLFIFINSKIKNISSILELKIS